ncbi:MAG: flagellar biosynthetic protein FliO [Candidatus Sumerlaeia bacterium]
MKNFSTMHRLLPVFLCLLLAVMAFAPDAALGQIRSDQDILNLDTDQPEESSDSEEKIPDPPGLWETLFRMLGALAIVLGLMFGVAWLWKKYAPQQKASTRDDVIRIVGSRMLGNKRSLLLVRVRGQTLLLGVTPQNISCLTEIHEVEGEWARPPEENGEAPKNKAFSRQLGSFLQTVVDDPEKNPPSKS